MYIVFEGIVGSGKTTQAEKLVEYFTEKYPDRSVTYTREPGGTKISEAIRAICQHVDFEDEMNPVTEAYLYASSRAQSLRQIVAPALENDGIVIADRSFLTSLTTQAFGRGLGFEKVLNINKVALANLIPDLIIYLEMPFEIGVKRTSDHSTDKFENYGKDFYDKVAEGYEFLSEHEEFKDRWVTIDAQGTEEEVFERLLKALNKVLD